MCCATSLKIDSLILTLILSLSPVGLMVSSLSKYDEDLGFLAPTPVLVAEAATPNSEIGSIETHCVGINQHYAVSFNAYEISCIMAHGICSPNKVYSPLYVEIARHTARRLDLRKTEKIRQQTSFCIDRRWLSRDCLVKVDPMGS